MLCAIFFNIFFIILFISTRFNEKQLEDMEYLLLGHLASIPFPTKHKSYMDTLVYTQTDRAFTAPTPNYLPYFHNCQFPRNPMRVVREAQKEGCGLSGVLRIGNSRLKAPEQMRVVLEENVGELMRVVNVCIKRFGEGNVLIE